MAQICIDWSPIATAPYDGTLLQVLVPRSDGGLIEGRARFDAEAYEGTWWWEGTSIDNYVDGPIDDINHGDPLFWRAIAANDA